MSEFNGVGVIFVYLSYFEIPQDLCGTSYETSRNTDGRIGGLQLTLLVLEKIHFAGN